MRFRNWPNRTLCDCLHEMRAILDKIGFWNYKKSIQILGSLIEEVQTYGNRMEAGLSDKRDISEFYDDRKKLIVEIEALEKKKAELEEDVGEDS